LRKSILYRCFVPETRLVGISQDILVSYDGSGCLTIEHGKHLSAISATPGESFVIEVGVGFAEVKEAT